MNGIYSKVARTWGVIFLVTGLGFVVAPDRVGTDLTGIAAFLGLEGKIEVPTGNLWYVLALSLMGSIVVLAELSARHPERPEPYAALLAAKLISTAGFASLALTSAPAWWICALSDGFIALTLWYARRRTPAPAPTAA